MAGLVCLGQPAGHVEGSAKVTGRALYTADVTLPGMLWGKCLRSPFSHACILSSDVAQARQLPGVHIVLTGADLPAVRLGRFLLFTLHRASQVVPIFPHTGVGVSP